MKSPEGCGEAAGCLDAGSGITIVTATLLNQLVLVMENPETPVVQVATAGEALVDLVGDAHGRFQAHPGGSVFNLTRALALQDVGTAYLNPLSADAFGRELAAQLAQSGARLAQPESVAEPTSLALVQVDAHGQPRYGFYREGVADRCIDADRLVAASRAYPRLQALCTGCLALAPGDQQRYLPWLRDGRRRGLLVVVDANLRPSAMDDADAWRASVRLALAEADVVKASDEDLATLDPGTTDPVAAARALFASTPARWIALTQGARGAWLFARDGRAWRAHDTADLRVQDTVGAGDCFLAGLLAPLLAAGRDADDAALADEALRRAVASASHCVQRAGCQPPRVADLAPPVLARVAVQPAD
jgi:fructokinase